MNIAITKIELDVKGVKISLTVDEAKTLQRELNSLFERVPVQYPYYRPWWYGNTVLCGNQSDNADRLKSYYTDNQSLVANLNGSYMGVRQEKAKIKI